MKEILRSRVTVFHTFSKSEFFAARVQKKIEGVVEFIALLDLILCFI